MTVASLSMTSAMAWQSSPVWMGVHSACACTVLACRPGGARGPAARVAIHASLHRHSVAAGLAASRICRSTRLADPTSMCADGRPSHSSPGVSLIWMYSTVAARPVGRFEPGFEFAGAHPHQHDEIGLLEQPAAIARLVRQRMIFWHRTARSSAGAGGMLRNSASSR